MYKTVQIKDKEELTNYIESRNYKHKFFTLGNIISQIKAVTSTKWQFQVTTIPKDDFVYFGTLANNESLKNIDEIQLVFLSDTVTVSQKQRLENYIEKTPETTLTLIVE